MGVKNGIGPVAAAAGAVATTARATAVLLGVLLGTLTGRERRRRRQLANAREVLTGASDGTARRPELPRW
ncbi:hypothetical protein C0036_11340 [Streptomyces sp. DJ]|nr:hypothetical protein C0036_11340 [Streptomyces sp. DJ]